MMAVQIFQINRAAKSCQLIFDRCPDGSIGPPEALIRRMNRAQEASYFWAVPDDDSLHIDRRPRDMDDGLVDFTAPFPRNKRAGSSSNGGWFSRGGRKRFRRRRRRLRGPPGVRYFIGQYEKTPDPACSSFFDEQESKSCFRDAAPLMIASRLLLRRPPEPR